jgi:hypothetical protein
VQAQRAARNRNCRLAKVAKEILENADLLRRSDA